MSRVRYGVITWSLKWAEWDMVWLHNHYKWAEWNMVWLHDLYKWAEWDMVWLHNLYKLIIMWFQY